MSQRSLALKRQLRTGKTVFGAWLSIADTAVAEIMATSGFDYVIIDTEHAPWSLESLQLAVMAFKGEQTVPIVRVPWNDPVYIKQTLDLGADGILAPMVRNTEEAKALLTACRYPPAGIRGFGPRRASNYQRDTDDYVATANESIIVVPQIEDIRTVDVIDEILKLGVDAICIGPNDLSGSAGLLRQHEHPTVKNALDRILTAAQAHGIAVCAGITLPAEKQVDWIARGARMVLVTSDVELLVKGAASALESVRALHSASPKP
jgi:2-keto-3-deoxy-L-rhamnonate aldolase RhmA